MEDDARRMRRRTLHRTLWLEMTFDEVPEDVSRAVVELWASGGTSTKVACEILDTDAAGLLLLAERIGTVVNRET